MNLFKKLFLGLVVFFLIFSFSSLASLAITPEECEQKVGKRELNYDQAKECLAILEDLYRKTGEQKRSLQGEITKFNAAIVITTTRIYTTIGQIEELEREIATLTAKIDRLDVSLDQLSEILIKRIAETYKKGKIEPLALFFSSKDFSEFVARYKYLRVIQLHDRKLLIQMETVRTNYEDQKTLKEEKQAELEAARKKLEEQKNLLAQQKADKENLLKITKNNELRYQQLLSITRAEIEAIQGIIAGKGQEVEVGKVGQGASIATIITGASACSTGTHLHFQVAEGSDVKNPFSYLRNINLIDDSGGDPYNATGDWDWPLNEPIRLTQGFGSDTSAIRSRIVWYNFHTGIDVVSDDRTVKAVKSGTLYRGAIACGGGTLRYVRVDHDDSNLDTYYLHVNY
jgi:peptidoglycan hydrolase CwlO-like protein